MAWTLRQPTSQPKADSGGLYGRTTLVGLMLMGLVACSSDSGSGGADNDSTAPDDATQATVQGQVINGPLAGADVRVFDVAGELLGSTTTDDEGNYAVDVPVDPPYNIVTEGGLLDGVPYQGSLKSLCETASSCAATPYTTVLVKMVEETGFNYDDAKARLAALTGINRDPFTNPDDNTESFRPEEARQAIDNGSSLETWVNSVVAWAQEPSQSAPPGVSASEPAPTPEEPVPSPDDPTPTPDEPVPSPDEPAPSPSFTITAIAGNGGSISPTTVEASDGEAKLFNVVPAANFEIDTVTGCDGTLTGNSYITGAITTDCQINATFKIDTTLPDAVWGEFNWDEAVWQ